jgi:hypothetical protein
VPATEIENHEAEMLLAYAETVELLAGRIAAAGLTATTPSLRRSNEGDPSTYGSEIEMSLLREGELTDALDVLLYSQGERRDVTPDELKKWLAREIESLAIQET